MIEIKSELTGVSEFSKFVKDFPHKIDEAIYKITDIVRTEVMKGTPVDEFTAVRSWGDVYKEGSGYAFETQLPYMHVLEYGLYPNVGDPKKTVRVGEHVYSTQAVDGWINKALDEEELVRKVSEALEKIISRDL